LFDICYNKQNMYKFTEGQTMKVTLLTYTPDPEKNVASAAKLCYAAADIDTVRDGLTPEKTAAFVEMLADMGHESPIEHASFTFGIEGVSRALLAQITRHRMASFSVQSQRYVRENQFEYVTPPEIAAVPEALELFEQAMQAGFSTAPDAIRSLGFGAGMGLPNMKRYTDYMDIQSKVGEGTRVVMRVNLAKG
jgi:thymidylate synthase ThyX